MDKITINRKGRNTQMRILTEALYLQYYKDEIAIKCESYNFIQGLCNFIMGRSNHLCFVKMTSQLKNNQ